MSKSSLGDSTEKTSCRSGNCPHYLAVKNRHMATVKKSGLALDSVDWDHLYNDHLRIWGEYGWEELTIVKEKLRSTEEELARLKEKLSAPARMDIDADPRNHVDGFCDAIIANNEFVWKCTDPVRYGKKVCSRHLKWTFIIGEMPQIQSKKSKVDLKHSEIAPKE